MQQVDSLCEGAEGAVVNASFPFMEKANDDRVRAPSRAFFANMIHRIIWKTENPRPVPTVASDQSNKLKIVGLQDFSVLPNTSNRLPRVPAKADRFFVASRYIRFYGWNSVPYNR